MYGKPLTDKTKEELMKDNKLLILGGKPIGSCEITKAAMEMGYYTIVADYLPVESSAAKRISDEHWDISTAEVDEMAKRCLEENVAGVITGVNEFNIRKKIEVCEKLSLPQYCSMKQWEFCENKAQFKKMCEKHGIPVARTYSKDDEIDFPVIVKPVDSSGSRGFSVCHNRQELDNAIELALNFSASKEYLIEEYIQCEATIIHYTAVEGEIIFSGMSDKHSQTLEGGSSVMALQTFPSASIERYLSDINAKAINMFKDLGAKNGPIWIEAFNDEKTGRFIFNEMGYRFGGSLTNYPVKHFYGIDQVDLLLKNAMGEKCSFEKPEGFIPETEKYCILPIHLKPGTIHKIEGVDKSEAIDGVVKVVLVHFEGDEIQDWGTAQQVFCYLHVAYNTDEELSRLIRSVKDELSVKDTDNNEMLFFLFDLKKLGVE